MTEERVRFSGRDVMEAVAAARKHFGVSRRDLGYEVISQPGVGAVDSPEADAVEIEAWKQPGAHPPRIDRDDDRPRRDRGDRRDHGGHRDRGDRRDRGGHRDRRGPRREDRDRPREEASFEQPQLLPDADVTDNGEILTKLVNGLGIGLDLRFYVEEIVDNEIGLRVNLGGADAALLLEEDAEGLDSLQYLANRILHRDGRVPGRVSFDADGYRAGQEKQLIESAVAAAEEVRSSGKVHKMPPMGPYERRLVHVALSEAEGIRTFSTGNGYRRRLHIAPAREKGGQEAAAAEAGE